MSCSGLFKIKVQFCLSSSLWRKRGKMGEKGLLNGLNGIISIGLIYAYDGAKILIIVRRVFVLTIMDIYYPIFPYGG